MARKKHTVEQIIGNLREAEVALSKSQFVWERMFGIQVLLLDLGRGIVEIALREEQWDMIKDPASEQ
jgi:hypothetical protein